MKRRTNPKESGHQGSVTPRSNPIASPKSMIVVISGYRSEANSTTLGRPMENLQHDPRQTIRYQCTGLPSSTARISGCAGRSEDQHHEEVSWLADSLAAEVCCRVGLLGRSGYASDRTMNCVL